MPFIIDGTTGFNLPSGADLTVNGNFTVSGTTTTINTETLTVDDNIIVLNNNEAGTPSENAGIEVERGTSTNVSIRWNETTDKWQFTNDGITYTDIGAGGDVVDDESPQLGGDLDVNNYNITGTGNVNITGALTASTSVKGNQLTINAATAPADPASGEAFIYATKSSGATGIRLHASGFTSEVLEVRMGSSSTNLMYLNNQGNVSFAGEVSASYFVDSSNSSYYLDPSATGTSLNVNGKVFSNSSYHGASEAEIKTSPIRIHSNTISTNTTVDTNENAVSGGPVTIATGVTVTVNGDWTVV